MLRKVHLHPDSMKHVTRIAFILPQSGNDEEFMVIDACNIGFKSLLEQAEYYAGLTKQNEAEQKALEKRREDYQLYLKLKAEFDPAA